MESSINFAKPRVVVSKCIEHEAVRYDAALMKSELVSNLKGKVEFITVCPEVGIGLPIPRETLRIVVKNGVKHLIQPATGLDFTNQMMDWIESTLKSLPSIDGVIMKAKSPSSGLFDAKYYPKIEKCATLGRGPGIFGEIILARYGDLAVEDEKRLLNPRIRKRFLTKLYTLASFRELKESGSVEGLVEFQNRNKLLLTAYSQKELRVLGRLVADRKNISPDEIFTQYENHLKAAIKHPPSPSTNINIASKSFGYFSEKLSKDEKQMFLNLLEQYKVGQVPFSMPSNLLMSWFTRFNVDYLLNQTFFSPYPKELLDLGINTIGYDERDLWKSDGQLEPDKDSLN